MAAPFSGTSFGFGAFGWSALGYEDDLLPPIGEIEANRILKIPGRGRIVALPDGERILPIVATRILEL